MNAQPGLSDLVGTEIMSTAYKAWLKRSEPLIVEAAAALLWPAPHLSPRNRSHGLLLHVPYDGSSKRFKVERFEELTLEEMSARTACVNGGEAVELGRLWPDGAPGPDPCSEKIKVLVFFSLDHGSEQQTMVQAIQPSLSGASVSRLKEGTWKLPTAEETFAKLNAQAVG